MKLGYSTPFVDDILEMCKTSSSIPCSALTGDTFLVFITDKNVKIAIVHILIIKNILFL